MAESASNAPSLPPLWVRILHGGCRCLYLRVWKNSNQNGGRIFLIFVAEPITRRKHPKLPIGTHCGHHSVYAVDPDGIEMELIWRIPNDDWDPGVFKRQPLDLDATRLHGNGDLATRAATGIAM
jgi:hypothetical protein